MAPLQNKVKGRESTSQ